MQQGALSTAHAACVGMQGWPISLCLDARRSWVLVTGNSWAAGSAGTLGEPIVHTLTPRLQRACHPWSPLPHWLDQWLGVLPWEAWNEQSH